MKIIILIEGNLYDLIEILALEAKEDLNRNIDELQLKASLFRAGMLLMLIIFDASTIAR